MILGHPRNGLRGSFVIVEEGRWTNFYTGVGNASIYTGGWMIDLNRDGLSLVISEINMQVNQ